MPFELVSDEVMRPDPSEKTRVTEKEKAEGVGFTKRPPLPF
jgi:hypothetical protein